MFDEDDDYFESDPEREERFYKQVLATLKRVPDDIVLAVAGRELLMSKDASCLCGWVMREAVARMCDLDAEKVTPALVRKTVVDPSGDDIDDSADTCRIIFGGADAEWKAIYAGVQDRRAPLIELALITRVNEAIRRGGKPVRIIPPRCEFQVVPL